MTHGVISEKCTDTDYRAGAGRAKSPLIMGRHNTPAKSTSPFSVRKGINKAVKNGTQDIACGLYSRLCHGLTVLEQTPQNRQNARHKPKDCMYEKESIGSCFFGIFYENAPRCGVTGKNKNTVNIFFSAIMITEELPPQRPFRDSASP